MSISVTTTSTWSSGAKEHDHHIPIPVGNAGDRISVVVSLFCASQPLYPADWNVAYFVIGGTCLACYYKESDGTETELLLQTFGPTNPKDIAASANVRRISGHDPATAPAHYVGAGGRQGVALQTNAPNPPSLPFPWGSYETLVEVHLGWRPATTAVTGYPTGYGNTLTDSFSPTNPNEGAAVASADLVVNAASEDPAAFALSAVVSTEFTVIAHKAQ